MDSLPDMATPRREHGCTTFVSTNGEKVRKNINNYLCSVFQQALLVAGGYDSSGDPTSSTELFFPSKNAWTTGGNLPRLKYLSYPLNLSSLSLQHNSHVIMIIKFKQLLQP